MKALFSVLSSAFLTVGSIIGAGFISGRELITFFGYENFIIYAIFSGVLLVFCLLLIYKAGRIYGDTENFNRALFSNPKPFNYAVIISTFISLGGVLSGLDSVFELGFLNKIPFVSIIVLIIANITSGFGVKGLERASMIIVPVTVVFTVIMLFAKGEFTIKCKELNILGGFKCLLYVSMNTFINLPVIISTAKDKGKISLIFSAITVSLILTGLSVMMLSAISFEGYIVANSNIPLMSLLKGKKASSLYSITLFSALLSSALTAYYPLYQVAVSRGKRGSLVWVSALLILFSRLGIKAITDYLYPVIGGFGAIYIVKCILFFCRKKKSKYKNFAVADNGNTYIQEAENEKKKKE